MERNATPNITEISDIESKVDFLYILINIMYANMKLYHQWGFRAAEYNIKGK